MQATSAETAKARIAALAYRYGNADTLAMEAAAKNHGNGCAAFWHSASASNDVVSGFLFYLNATQDVARAWDAEERDWNRPSRMRDEAHLDALLPLNPQAVHSLADAYAALGTFRTAAELFRRMDRADEEALDALGKLRANGGSKLFGGLNLDRIAEAERAVSHHGRTAGEVAGAVKLSDAMEAA